MSVLMVSLPIAVALGLGVALLYRIGLHGRAHPSLWLGAGYGVGLAMVSFGVALPPLVRLPLTVGWGGLFVALTWCGLWLVSERLLGCMKQAPPAGPSSKPPRWENVVWGTGLVLLVVKAGFIGVSAMDKPVMGWDAVAIHSLRAKAMFYDQTIARSTLEWIGAFDYPLGIPLLELWVTWFQGGWDDTAFKILFPGFLFAVLGMVYGVLREFVRPLTALAGVWLVASLPLLVQHTTDAYLDLPLAYTTLGVSIFLWRHTRTGEMGDVFIASLMAAFGVWIKREGVVAAGVGLVLLALWAVMARSRTRREALRALAIFAGMPGLVVTAWAVFRWAGAETPSLSFQPTSLADLVSRSIAVVVYAARELWTSSNWNVLWPLFAGFWALHARKSLSSESLFFAWPVVITFGTLLAVSASTEMGEYLKQGTTLHRMALHVAPLAAVFVAVRVGDTWAQATDPLRGRDREGRRDRARPG
ncbi:MAG: hypothetical protein AB1451_15570 [Nitrospirota bacterium]